MQTRIFLENIDFALRITVKRGAMHSAVYPLLTEAIMYTVKATSKISTLTIMPRPGREPRTFHL